MPRRRWLNSWDREWVRLEAHDVIGAQIVSVPANLPDRAAEAALTRTLWWLAIIFGGLFLLVNLAFYLLTTGWLCPDGLLVLSPAYERQAPVIPDTGYQPILLPDFIRNCRARNRPVRYPPRNC